MHPTPIELTHADYQLLHAAMMAVPFQGPAMVRAATLVAKLEILAEQTAPAGAGNGEDDRGSKPTARVLPGVRKGKRATKNPDTATADTATKNPDTE